MWTCTLSHFWQWMWPSEFIESYSSPRSWKDHRQTLLNCKVLSKTFFSKKSIESWKEWLKIQHLLVSPKECWGPDTHRTYTLLGQGIGLCFSTKTNVQVQHLIFLFFVVRPLNSLLLFSFVVFSFFWPWNLPSFSQLSSIFLRPVRFNHFFYSFFIYI